MRLEETTFVVTDTETTGSRAGEDRMIEIGAVKVRGAEVVGTFQHLVNPGRHVPRRITLLTGISTAMVFDQPAAADILPAWLDFLGEDVLVAHNLPFDRRVIDQELALAGLPPLKGPSLCTLRLARRLVPTLSSKGLTALTDHFEIRVNGRHRALGDAEATAKLLLHFVERLKREFGIETAEELLAFQHRRYRDTRREPAHLVRIRKEVLPRVPDRPGVYFMRDKRGQVIYVGKAKRLSARVRTYFNAVDNHAPHIQKLVREVRDVTWEETGTELAALLEESRLIKHHLPHFNRAGRRYRDYPFLKLDTTHPYPTLSWVHFIEGDGAEYYGPLPRRYQAEELVELIGRLFQLRECDDPVFHLGRPCLYHAMGRCTAPCVGGEGAAVYPRVVDQVRRFLTGHDETALATVEAAMHEAAAGREFELAGYYRDQLRRLERMLDYQRRVAGAVHDHHAVLIEPEASGEASQLFMIRAGRLAGRLRVPTPPDAADLEALAAALAAAFSLDAPVPERFDRQEVDAIRILAHWMRLHPARMVRWAPGLDPDLFLSRVLDALVAAVPDDAEAIEEEE
ncbi:MAG TPA: DEDD exonuclease domain-containing protein [Rubricoccaceae bacterium]|nr:DEDD exonuclease domain-containing protein [Rubricoccaceae bacterium]